MTTGATEIQDKMTVSRLIVDALMKKFTGTPISISSYGQVIKIDRFEIEVIEK